MPARRRRITSRFFRSRGRRPVVVLILALAGCSFLGCDEKKASKTVALIISGDTAGWLTPCGCASNQSGGLLRRGSYLASLEKEAQPIYLDAGGAPGGTSDYHKVRFEAILAGEKLGKIAAHNIGRAEAEMGA